MDARAEDPLAPTADFQARVVAGRALAERGDFDGAEATFRALLFEARDREPGNHARALASLATLYGRAGRYFQAHALASRLAALARAAGGAADPTLAFALAKTCGALSQLRLVEPLADALGELRDVLDRHPEPLPNLELEYEVAAAARARIAGDVAGARRHVERYRRALEQHRVPEAVYRWALTMADARLLVEEGRAAEARELVARLGKDVPAPAFAPLHGLVVVAEIHAALGEREDAVGCARQALDLLAAVDRESFLAADFVHQGDLLARSLESLGEVELARRACDLMAVAVLLNLKQVDDCIRTLPELGLEDAAAHAALALFRKQFLREQRALLGRVAALLSRREDCRLHAILEHPGHDGLVPVCAWCESVRTSEGFWLPIGHFIPRDGTFLVTHGICPTCASGFPASSRSRAASG
jgi:tetratricopeptide (TPR) repeat protein